MKLRIVLKSVYTSFTFLLLSGCLHKHELPAAPSPIVVHGPVAVSDNASSMVTVFIHGTRIFPKFYAQELFYSPDGFKNIASLEADSHMHTIAHALEKADPKRFSYASFYTFGWNGNLDFNERKKAAGDFYNALKEFSKTYVNMHGKSPKLRIITHSHGGNVALNLAAVAKELHDPMFHVDELILLACPVQHETKDFVVDPIFGQIYSLSSRNDILQVIDPQGLYPNDDEAPLFSERYFDVHQHLLQAKVKMSGRYIVHPEFLAEKFFIRLPEMMDTIDVWQRPLKAVGMGSKKIPTIDVHSKAIKIYPKICPDAAIICK